MAKAEKAPNYSDEQVAILHEAWAKAPTAETLEALAAQFGKTVASVRQRLVRDGLYHKAPAKDKAGREVISKESLADMIAEYLPGVDPENAGSLAKANKGILRALLSVLKDAAEFKKAAQESFDESVEELTEQEAENLFRQETEADY